MWVLAFVKTIRLKINRRIFTTLYDTIFQLLCDRWTENDGRDFPSLTPWERHSRTQSIGKCRSAKLFQNYWALPPQKTNSFSSLPSITAFVLAQRWKITTRNGEGIIDPSATDFLNEFFSKNPKKKFKVFLNFQETTRPVIPQTKKHPLPCISIGCLETVQGDTFA